MCTLRGLPAGTVVKSLPAKAGVAGDTGSVPGLGRSPGEGNGYTRVFLPGEFHGQTNLAGYSPWGHKELDYSPWGHKELDMTE